MRYKRESPYVYTEYIFLGTEPTYLNDIIGPVCSYIAVAFNIFIIVILFAKKLSTPSSVLMQGLALSDGLTSLFAYGLEPFIVPYYNRENGVTVINYPMCKVHNYKALIAELFHLVSVLITMSLGIQKCLAIKWPVWSYTVLSRKMMLVALVVIYLISIAFHVPRILVANFRKREFSDECEIAALSESLLDYTFIYFPMISAIILFVATLVMIATTITIIYFLVKKRNIRVNESESLRTIRRRSTMLIAVLTIFFLIIECPRIFVFGVIQLSGSKQEYSAQLLVEYNTQLLISAAELFNIRNENLSAMLYLKLFTEIVRLLVVIGCLSNFIIYISMSQTIRSAIKTMFTFPKR